MGFFDKIKEPIFLKEDSSAKTQLIALQELAKTAEGKLAEQIDQNIKLVEAGIIGEDSIKFELRNSHIPMFVLHDLYLEFNGLSAQIDFLVITRKHHFVIECKNLYGNIEINNSGDFVRTVSFGRYKKKEGIYSPITQNKRHLDLIKQIRSSTKSNLISRALFEKEFYNNYRSIVVLANPKTILNAKFAKKEIKSQVIRADQLSAFIQRIDAEPGSIDSSEKDMESLARYFLRIHKPQEIDYTEKYRINTDTSPEKPVDDSQTPVSTEQTSAATEQEPDTAEQLSCPKCGAPLVRRKAARGANSGKEFFGCSNFPKCRHIIPIV